jgi:hypothetical protein
MSKNPFYKNIDFKHAGGSEILMIVIPTKEDLLRVHSLFEANCPNASYDLNFLNNNWSKNTSVVLFQPNGMMHVRSVNDSTYTSYKASLIPLEEFYKTYDIQAQLSAFEAALTTLEKRLQ